MSTKIKSSNIETGAIDTTALGNLSVTKDKLHTNVIPDQVILAGADIDAVNDYMLIYDASAVVLKKVSVANIKPNFSSFSEHIIPDTDITYDLGSAAYKWRDIYLSGNTIHLGDTLISKTSEGNVAFKDGNDNLKRVIVDEIQIGEGASKIRISKSYDSNTGKNRIKFDEFDINDVKKTNAQQSSVDLDTNDSDDLSEGSTNLYFTSARTRSAITKSVVEGLGIDLPAADLTGTIATTRLGSGTASNTTFLRGDNAWATVNTNLVADTSPQLGGNLDLNNNNITGTGGIPAANLTGTIAASRLSTATTQAESDDSTKIATTAYVVDKITTLIGGAPSTLNDLNELAAAINDDAAYNSTLTTALGTKLPKSGGALTGAVTTNSTFDGRNVSVDGSKLDGIATSANNYSLPASVIHQTELSSSISSTSTTVAANLAGVKAAYDRSWPNTTYSVGDGGLSQINFTSADHSKLNGIETGATTAQPIAATTIGSGHNIDSLPNNGWYKWSSGVPTNAPYSYGLLLNSTDGSQPQQLVQTYGGSSNKVRLLGRRKTSSTWDTSWTEYWSDKNDGSGSGLDADTVDGIQGASFLRSDADDSYSGNLNVNGFIFKNDSNGPHNLKIQPSATSTAAGISTYLGNGSHAFQLYGDGSGYGFLDAHWAGWDIKKIKNGIFEVDEGSGLQRVWNAGNDGSGSGLDADLLDGQQGSYYAPNSSLGDYVLKGGTTSLGAAWRNTFYSGAGGVNFLANHYSMGVDIANGSWSGTHYSDLVIGYHTGIRIGAAYGGTRFYDNSPTTDTNNDGHGDGAESLLMTVGGHLGGSGVNISNNLTVGGTLTHTGQIGLLANNYGGGGFGRDSATRYQHVWSMGTAYKTSADGTSYGNMYGLTWTHSNVGVAANQSISGLGHQLQLRMNGTLYAAIGSGIWTSGNITAYSDIAVKTNLVPIPNALSKVMQISGYTYDRTDYEVDPVTGIMPDTRQAGVVAQEVEKVLPEVVTGIEGNKAVAYGNMVALLIEAIKEQQVQIDELKALVGGA